MNSAQGYLLIVEDDADILNLLKTSLTFHGYRVRTARNGYEGLQAIQNEPPAIVIADIMMPKLDGFGLINRLRINPETRKIPVVVITATYVALEDKEFAQHIGATIFMQKPIDLEQFRATIKRLLEHGAPAAPEPLRDFDFYDGYRKRLEAKLEHKVAQIERDQLLLQSTLSDAERHSLQVSLIQAINERAEMELLLEQIHEQLKRY